jgi:hypothetical protein
LEASNAIAHAKHRSRTHDAVIHFTMKLVKRSNCTGTKAISKNHDSNTVRPPDIKALAENWYKPQLEERPTAFHRAVQGKLGELSALGMARSPVAYFTAETLAQQEVEQYGQIFFAGSKQAFAAVSTPISSPMLAQML